MRDKLGRRAGDSLCGVAVTATGAAIPENEPFSETRALLSAARAQRAAQAESSSALGPVGAVTDASGGAGVAPGVWGGC